MKNVARRPRLPSALANPSTARKFKKILKKAPSHAYTDRQNRWYEPIEEEEEEYLHFWCYIPKRGRDSRFGAADPDHSQQPNDFPDLDEEVHLYGAVDPQPYQMTIRVHSYVQRGKRTDTTQHLVAIRV